MGRESKVSNDTKVDGGPKFGAMMGRGSKVSNDRNVGGGPKFRAMMERGSIVSKDRNVDGGLKFGAMMGRGPKLVMTGKWMGGSKVWSNDSEGSPKLGAQAQTFLRDIFKGN